MASAADASLHSAPIASGLLSLRLPSPSSASSSYSSSSSASRNASSLSSGLPQRRFPSVSCRFPPVSSRFPQISRDPCRFPLDSSDPCCLPPRNASLQRNGGRFVVKASSSSSSSSANARPPSQPRFIQHKQEAFWFYRFLSIVYDHIINPGHWTVDMREDALEPADLNDPNLSVVDVGGGTGFCTQGIVKTVNAKNVTILDQSPHQLAKAREKEDLKECTIIEGDAEDLPFPTDSVDRYVSAGSIEYWPDPQRGITEAYRVLKKGGKACIIGPVHPTFWLSRFFADIWMLFPTEEEYIEWFTKAGFSDVKIKRIGPSWYRGVRRHGLIMGCSVTGVKSVSGESPLQLGPKAEDVKASVNPFVFLYRFLLGVIASIYYVLVPIYMWLKDQIVPKGQPL